MILGAIALVSAAAGFLTPRLLMTPPAAKEPPAPKAPEPVRPAVLPFGDVVVNLGEDRLTRYLRVKVMLVVEGNREKAIQEMIQREKPFLKNWLIGYLSDLSMKEVGRAAAVNRIRREIRSQFNTLLDPAGSEPIAEVLFDEFVVQ